MENNVKEIIPFQNINENCDLTIYTAPSALKIDHESKDDGLNKLYFIKAEKYCMDPGNIITKHILSDDYTERENMKNALEPLLFRSKKKRKYYE